MDEIMTLKCTIAELEHQLDRQRDQLREHYTYVSVSTYSGFVRNIFDTYAEALNHVAGHNLSLDRTEDKWHRDLLLLAPYKYRSSGKVVYPDMWRTLNVDGMAYTELLESVVGKYDLHGIERHNMHD